MAETIKKIMTFEQYEAELRRKTLQKALSPAVVGDGNGRIVKSWQSPSISSIPFDSSHTTTPSQTGSGIDKEIVSSSNNLRNTYSKMQHVKGNQKKIVASSIKGSSMETDDETDRLAMPPPKFQPYLSHSIRKSCRTSSRDRLSKLDEHTSSDIEHESPKKKYNCGERGPDSFISPRINADTSPRKRRAHTFQKWTIALNERKELVVIGKMENGQFARSKPILKRLGSSKLESVSGYLYHLQGNLVDNDHVLPEYVRGKFCYGFPDDWENVHEIWRTYVQKGSRITFRWPTPITDSDDDLNSEVTDITFANLKDSKKGAPDFDSSGGSPEIPLNSESTYKSLRIKNKRDAGSRDCLKSDSFTQTSVSDVMGHLTHKKQREICSSPKNFSHDDKENADTSRVSVAAKKLVNRMNSIINMLENSRSVECIDKLNVLLDWFSISELNGSTKEGDTSKEVSKSIDDPNSLNVTYDFVKRIHAQSTPSRNTTNKEIVSCDNLSQRKRKFSRAIGNDNDSDSEVYSGVTKIQLSQVIRPKETVLKPSKRKLRKQEVPCSPKEPTVTLNHAAHSSAGKVTEEKRHWNAASDVSSIMYEDNDRLRVKNHTHSDTRNIAERHQLGKNENTKDKIACEIKERSVHERSTEPIPQESRNEIVTKDKSRKHCNAESDDSSVSIMYDENDRLKNCTLKLRSNIRSVAERHQPGKKEHTTNRNACGTKRDSVHNRSFEPIPQISRTGKVAEDNKKRQLAESDDSSVSMMYENDRSRVKNSTISKTKSVAERTSQSGKNECTKDKNACEVKKHSLRERSSKPIPKTSQIECPIQNSSVKRANNDKVVEINLTESNKVAEENNYQNESFLEKSGKSINSPGLQHILNKITAKPVVISSVPVDIKIDRTQINYLSRNGKEEVFENAEKKTSIDNIERDKNDRKNLIRKKSPLKFDNRRKSTFSNDTYNDNDDGNRHTEFADMPETNNIDSIVSNKENDVIVSKDSNDNSKPKLLSAWAPRVIACGNDLYLIFEGNLTNEAGHVINKKFKTDKILRRVSTRLVETVHHEYYQLIGSSNVKHVVPKKLLNRCRHGCPARIEQFCEAWKSLKNVQADSDNKSTNSSQNAVNVFVSSKGRRIISPLNFWKGERVMVKGEDVYVSGDSRNSSQNSIENNSTPKRKKDNSTEVQRDSRGNVDDKKMRRGESKTEGNIQIANARVVLNRVEPTTASHLSPKVRRQQNCKVLCTYQRDVMIPRDDTSCDEQISRL